jgi:iron(III) transport system permease protein
MVAPVESLRLADGRRPGRGRGRRRSAGALTLPGSLLLVVVFVLVAGPLLLLLYGSLTNQQLPTSLTANGLGLQNYRTVFGSTQLAHVALNTLVYVAGTALFGTLIAAALAYLTERTALPFKGLWYGLIVAGFAMPSIVQAIAWEFLLNPRGGSLNPLLTSIWHPLGSLTANSLYGMVFVASLHAVPMSYVMFVPLMRNIDTGLEEAAVTSGAHLWPRLRTVTMPLLLPGALAVIIYQGIATLEGFEIPGILGMPSGNFVFSTYLYNEVHSNGSLPYYNLASALGMGLLAIAAIAMYLYFRVVTHAARFATMTGRGFQRRPRPLGRWAPGCVVAVALYVIVAMLLPFLIMLYTSLVAYAHPVSWSALQHLTLANYSWSADGYDLAQVLVNTIIVTLVTAAVTVLLSASISYVVIKSRFRFRRLLDVLAFVPHGVPGIVVGLAFFLIFLHIGFLYSSLIGMIIAFTASFIAYGTRSMNAAFLQVHSVLEEAATTAGIRHGRRLTGILFPLVRPSLVGLFIIVALMVTRVAGLPLMLTNGATNTTILSVVLWNLWNGGSLPAAAAIGTVLIAVTFILSMAARRFGMGRSG